MEYCIWTSCIHALVHARVHISFNCARGQESCWTLTQGKQTRLWGSVLLGPGTDCPVRVHPKTVWFICLCEVLWAEKLTKACYWTNSETNDQIISLSFHYIFLFNLLVSKGKNLISQTGAVTQLIRVGEESQKSPETQPSTQDFRANVLRYPPLHMLFPGGVTFISTV